MSSRFRLQASGKSGFTIIEVTIVLFIVGILAALAIPAYNNFIDRSSYKLSVKNIRLMENALKRFEIENMRLPNSLNELGQIDFLDYDMNPRRQSAPFLDSWGNPYRFLNLANDNPPAYPNARRDRGNKPLSLDYDLYSMGADGRTAKPVNSAFGKDDIVRANSGAYVGLGENY
jgi:general secretion pathway protein G